MSQDLVDDEAINQLIEMDEDDNHDFSKEILQEFFAQLNNKVPEFDRLLQERNYTDAGKLGHYLKGSSAGVGASKIRDICDHIQHYETETTDPGTFFREKVDELKTVIPATRVALYNKVGLSV
jgi:osomolarity two-component system, phosphorelay intermediate protein YPD1